MKNSAVITFSPSDINYEKTEGVKFTFNTDHDTPELMIEVDSDKGNIVFFVLKRDISRLNDLITKHVTYEK